MVSRLALATIVSAGFDSTHYRLFGAGWAVTPTDDAPFCQTQYIVCVRGEVFSAWVVRTLAGQRQIGLRRPTYLCGISVDRELQMTSDG